VTAKFGAFVLDSDRRQLTRGGSEIHLTPTAFDLLEMLVKEAPRVLRKTELHERLWPATFVSDATLVSLVKELRRAMDDHDRLAPILRTAHGVGYAFAAPFDRAASPSSTVSHWIVTGGRRIPLTEGDNVIGRDPAATVCVDVPGVSRRHAHIVIDDSGARLEDLASKNGTRVGETLVAVKTALRDGDQIHVSPATVIYHASASGISTATVIRK
jgi:DNA-binding winged helix-turn-helix (wHTH) protein